MPPLFAIMIFSRLVLIVSPNASYGNADASGLQTPEHDQNHHKRKERNDLPDISSAASAVCSDLKIVTLSSDKIIPAFKQSGVLVDKRE